MARSRRRGPKRSNAFVGLMAAIVCALILFFGFTKDIPFTSGLPAQGAVRVGELDPAQLAGPDRRRRGRQGQVGRAGRGHQRRAARHGDQRRRGCRSTSDATAKIRPRIFLEGNFFVDLKPGTPDAPVLDSGETIKITQTATPVQLDQVLTSLQSDSREDLTALLDGLSTALNSKPTAGAGPRQPRAGQGADRRRVLQRRLRRHPGRRALERDRLRGAARHRAAAATCARLIRGTARHGRRAEPLREPAPGPDHEPQPDDGGVRVGVHEPARVDPRAGADAAQRQQPRSTRSTRRSRPTRAFATEIRPGRARDAGHDRGRVPVDRADPRAGRRGRARRAGRGALARHRRPGAADRPRVRAAAADRPRVQVRARRRPARRRPRDPGRVHDRRGELQGVLLRARGHRRRGPEHRRQRHVRALPDRRRHAVGVARPVGHQPRRAVRQQHRRPARQPPRVSGQAAAVQAERALLHSRSCRTSTAPRRRSPRPVPRRWPASRARASATSSSKQAELEAVRRKLNPFGAKRRSLAEKPK